MITVRIAIDRLHRHPVLPVVGVWIISPSMSVLIEKRAASKAAAPSISSVPAMMTAQRRRAQKSTIRTIAEWTIAGTSSRLLR
jgi:hypothetical protein